MSITVNKQTITVESFSWGVARDVSREEAGIFLNELTRVLRIGDTVVSKPVYVDDTKPVAVYAQSVVVAKSVVEPVVSKSVVEMVDEYTQPVAGLKIRSGLIDGVVCSGEVTKITRQVSDELYVSMRYRPELVGLSARLSVVGYGVEELTIMKRVLTMLGTYTNLKQDKMQLDLGLRPYQFEKMFEVYFESTFAGVQREVTLMRGARLLEDGLIDKIVDIGKMLGYSKAGFRSAFVGLFGVCPNDYRISVQKAKGKQALAELVHG